MVNTFAEADIFYWNLELVADANDNTTLGSTIEFGNGKRRVNLACPRATLLEALERGEPIECIAEDYAAL